MPPTHRPLIPCFLILALALATLGCVRQQPEQSLEYSQLRQVEKKLEHVHLLMDRGRYDEALPLAVQGVAAAEALGGVQGQQQLEIALLYLFNIHTVLDNTDQALEVAEQVLKVAKYLYGATSREYAETLEIAAGATRDVGQTFRSRDFATQAMRLWQSLLPRGSVELAEKCHLYGTDMMDLYIYQQHDATLLADAEPYLEEAVGIRWANLGPSSIDSVYSIVALCSVRALRGKTDQALDLYAEAMEELERSLGPAHYNYGVILDSVALLLLDLGHLERAEALAEGGLAVMEANVPPDHPDMARSMNTVAATYMAQGRYSSAKTLLERAARILGDKFGTRDWEYLATVERLEQCREAASQAAARQANQAGASDAPAAETPETGTRQGMSLFARMGKDKEE